MPPLPCLLLSLLLVQEQPAPPDTVRGRTLVLPVIGYSERTGVQLGATVFRTHAPAPGVDPGTRASTDGAFAARTTDDYVKAYVQVDRWTPGNLLHVRARAAYQSYPLPYYGIGAGAPDEAEEWYSAGVTTLHLFVEPALRTGSYLHAGWRAIHTRLRETEPAGALDAGAVPVSSGGLVSHLDLGFVQDTRDHPAMPRDGGYARVVASLATSVLGSDHAFRRLTVDARRYVGLARDAGLALQLQFDAVGGAVPFDQLPMVGADSAMRGYPVGRYRDRQALTAQAEVRTGHWRRAGFVVFAGAGTVAPTTGDFLRVAWYPTVGAGARLLIGPRSRSVLRADIGIGRGSLGVNVGIGEAF